MHDPERQALSRAALLLLAVSVLRWGLAARPSGSGAAPGGSDVLAGHIAATDVAVDEQDRRGRPLEDGERIDPNAASEVELDRLPGIGPSTAAAIVAARDSGTVFGRPDDLLAVRGIGPATLSRLRTWIELPPVARGRADRPMRSTRAAPGGGAGRGGRGPATASDDRPAFPVDVNRADVETLQHLPGIGPALAARIVAARAERPFASVRDLERVRGIGPSTVARLEAVAVAEVRR